MNVLYSFLLLLAGPGPPRPAGEAAPHQFYVSYGRMAVEGSTAVCRIRFFRDDLELALGTFHKRPDFRIGVSAEADSLFLAYLQSTFHLRAGNNLLTASLLGSGEEADMWWYTLEFTAPAPLRRLKIQHRMLFDVLGDQRNLLKVVHFPDEKEQTLYFVRGEEEHEIAF